MNGNARLMLASVGVIMMAASGCANKEVVKKEEPIAQQTARTKVEAAKPAKPAVKPAAEQMKPVEVKNEKTSKAVEALETIYFGFDKSDLSQASRDALTKNAATLKATSGAKVRIEGNCDERGSAEYNLALGERRAKTAMQYLITLGIPADRLSVVSYGKERPAVQGHDEAAWAKNRRDDFVVQ
ncbi:MAG TPA: peptidoglycan-associated lipoprotein Pal [Geobacteraceae bacterium]